MSKIFILSLLVCLWLAPAARAQLTAAEMREKATAETKARAAAEEMQRQELVNLQGETVRAIQMNNTSSTLCHTAAVLCSNQTNSIPKHPKQWSIRIYFYVVALFIDI